MRRDEPWANLLSLSPTTLLSGPTTSPTAQPTLGWRQGLEPAHPFIRLPSASEKAREVYLVWALRREVWVPIDALGPPPQPSTSRVTTLPTIILPSTRSCSLWSSTRIGWEGVDGGQRWEDGLWFGGLWWDHKYGFDRHVFMREVDGLFPQEQSNVVGWGDVQEDPIDCIMRMKQLLWEGPKVVSTLSSSPCPPPSPEPSPPNSSPQP